MSENDEAATIREFEVRPGSGYGMLAFNILLHLAFVGVFVAGLTIAAGGAIGFGLTLLALSVIGTAVVGLLDHGLFLINPNEAKVLQLFGTYVGTVHEPGLKFANPFYIRRRVSMRVRNFESGKLKVNDASGSPIEIAAVVVWRVVDTGEALFEVDDYREFVRTQSEAAIRLMASSYPYESGVETAVSLRRSPTEVAESLRDQIQRRLHKAGVEVVEARISHLAYSPEIAGAMLRRQQAGAIIAAKAQIVEGAVSMVESALDKLAERDVLELDEERKAAMVSNLLVVLCADQETQPVVNTGTLYS